MDLKSKAWTDDTADNCRSRMQDKNLSISDIVLFISGRKVTGHVLYIKLQGR